MPSDSPLKRFAQRFIYNGIDQIALRDLGFGRRAIAPPPAVPSLPAPVDSRLPPAPTLDVSNNQSPPLKRPFRDSRSPPRQRTNQSSLDRSQSPNNKRFRPTTSPPPPRRYPLPERDRIPSGGRYGRDDRSPLPLPSIPPQAAGRDRGSLPPQAMPPMSNRGPPSRPSGPPPPPRGQYDRSGLTRPLTWFIDSLPSARSFSGEYLN